MKLIKKMVRKKTDSEIKDYYQIAIERIGKEQIEKMKKLGVSIPVVFS